MPRATNNGGPEKDALFVAPWTPSEVMWGGLARSIMMWLDFGPRHTPSSLLKHLERTGIEAPAWLLAEPEMQSPDHSMSKGTRCVLIYRAMIWDGRAQHLTPSGHTPDCDEALPLTSEHQMALAVLEATRTPEAAQVEMLAEILGRFVEYDDDAKAAAGKGGNLNGYGHLFDSVGHPFGAGEHKQQPYRSVNLDVALQDARAALAQVRHPSGERK